MRIDYVCETCGQKGYRIYPAHKVPKHLFCSRECQNVWQKSREDIVLKNKDPMFRKKVSEGLKRRKRELGEKYHSPETKRKIGDSTIQHWNSYDDEKRNQILKVLQDNAAAKRTYGPYDLAWHQLSRKMCENGVCHRCGSKENLNVHHIIPVREGGNRDLRNLVVLCKSCHTLVEYQQQLMNEILHDWDVVQILVRERLHCL